MANPILLDLAALEVETFDPAPEPAPEPLPLTPTWEKDCTKPLLCPA